MAKVELLFLALCLLLTSSQAQYCALFENEGECVQNVLPCPFPKIVSTNFNCGSPFEKCCYRPNGPVPPTPTTTATPPPTTTTADPPQPTCGLRTVGRIFNGVDAGNICKWPWMVSIRIRVNSNDFPVLTNTISYCSGVLVDRTTVLTSASCLHSASIINGNKAAAESLLVIAGDYAVNAFDPQSTGVLRESFHSVNRTLIHPRNFKPDETTIVSTDFADQQPSRKDYNIAVLKLNFPVVLGNCREAVCLPTLDDVITFDGVFERTCYVASWGKFDVTQNLATVLKEAKLNIFPEGVCTLIDRTYTPAGGSTCGQAVFDTGNNLCQGDDGGMVVCQDVATSQWTLNGLINFPYFSNCGASTNGQLMTITNIRSPELRFWLDSVLKTF